MNQHATVCYRLREEISLLVIQIINSKGIYQKNNKSNLKFIEKAEN